MKIGKIVISVLSALVLWLVYYLCLPTLSLAYISGFAYIAACILTVAVNIAMWSSEEWKRAGITLGVGAIAFIVVVLVGCIAGCALFNASTMRNQLGSVQEISFEEMIHQIDMSQIPIVDDEFATKQADKKNRRRCCLGLSCRA